MNARVRRIVLSLPSAVPGNPALRLIARLAGRMDARVDTVFVEDARILEMAANPVSRVVHAGSLAPSSMDLVGMQRALRAASARARERLAAALVLAEHQGSFSSRRCMHVAESFSEANRGDLIIVPLLASRENLEQVADLFTAVAAEREASLLILNEASEPDSSIVAVFDGDDADLRAAIALASDFDCELRVLTTGRSEEDSAALEARARAILEREAPHTPHSRMTLDAAAPLLDQLAAWRPGTVVLDRTGPTATVLDVRELLSRVNTSLYLRD